jgi:DMSO/TMAO reductase YedYZ molybdopterin-dependent catalytic subunit
MKYHPLIQLWFLESRLGKSLFLKPARGLGKIARVAGLDPRVKYVEFRSFDNDYWSGWDLASVLHPQTMLAYWMNGHSLGANHGAPLRLYSAIKLGYKSVKYLTEMNFLPNKIIGTAEGDNYDWFGGI